MTQTEIIADFDAWAHAECGLNNIQRAEYTRQEIARLQLGWIRRYTDVGTGGAVGGAAEQQRRKIQRGHQDMREDMLRDVGFE